MIIEKKFIKKYLTLDDRIMENILKIKESEKRQYALDIVLQDDTLSLEQLLYTIEQISLAKNMELVKLIYEVLGNAKLKESPYYNYTIEKIANCKNPKVAGIICSSTCHDDLLQSDYYTKAIDKMFNMAHELYARQILYDYKTLIKKGKIKQHILSDYTSKNEDVISLASKLESILGDKINIDKFNFSYQKVLYGFYNKQEDIIPFLIKFKDNGFLRLAVGGDNITDKEKQIILDELKDAISKCSDKNNMKLGLPIAFYEIRDEFDEAFYYEWVFDEYEDYVENIFDKINTEEVSNPKNLVFLGYEDNNKPISRKLIKN